MFGRDNTVTKKESLDVLDVMLKALAEIDGSTKVVEEMLLKSCEAYKRAADDYYGGIQTEIEIRKNRYKILEDEVKSLNADRDRLDSELGEALVNGDEKAEADAEQKLQEVDRKLFDIKRRQELFLNAKVPTGNNVLFAELEKRYAEFETAVGKYGKFIEELHNATDKSIGQLQKLTSVFCRGAVYAEGKDGLDKLACDPMKLAIGNYNDVYMTFWKYDMNKLRKCHEGKAIMSEVMG